MGLSILYQILRAADRKIDARKLRKLVAEKGFPEESIDQIEAAWDFVKMTSSEQEKLLLHLEKEGIDTNTASARMMIRLHNAFLHDEIARHLIPKAKQRQQFLHQLETIAHAAKIQLSVVTPIEGYHSLDEISKAEQIGRRFVRIFDLRDLHLPTVVHQLETLWSLSGQLAVSTNNEELRLALASLITAINGHRKATELTLQGKEVDLKQVEAIIKNITGYNARIADLNPS